MLGVRSKMALIFPDSLRAAMMTETFEEPVEVFADGACRGNPGPGGWGALLVWGDHEKELLGGDSATTNNRMELQAAIAALQALKELANTLLHRTA